MPTISEQVRRLIRQLGLKACAICKATGIDQLSISSISRSLAGNAGLSMKRLDRIGALLKLQVVKGKPKGR